MLKPGDRIILMDAHGAWVEHKVASGDIITPDGAFKLRGSTWDRLVFHAVDDEAPFSLPLYRSSEPALGPAGGPWQDLFLPAGWNRPIDVDARLRHPVDGMASAAARAVTILLPDGFEHILNAERAFEGAPAKAFVTDAECTEFIRGFFYAYLREIAADGLGPRDYAERYKAINHVRA